MLAMRLPYPRTGSATASLRGAPLAPAPDDDEAEQHPDDGAGDQLGPPLVVLGRGPDLVERRRGLHPRLLHVRLGLLDERGGPLDQRGGLLPGLLDDRGRLDLRVL